MSGTHSAPGCFAEREAQVLGLFRDHHRGLRFLASLDAFRSEYLDLFDETEWTGDIYEQASEYADEQLREWGGHLQWDPEVLRGPDARLQLDLERHGGRTVDGVTVRVLQRVLALTAAIWHNDATGQPVMRSLVAYDH